MTGSFMTQKHTQAALCHCLRAFHPELRRVHEMGAKRAQKGKEGRDE